MRIETVICQRCGQPVPRYNVQGAKLCTDCYREFLEFFRDFLNEGVDHEYMKPTELEKAYKAVYNDLMKVDLFRGHYDARHGNQVYMHGVCTVMENIALHVSEKTANEYTKIFFNNIIGSQKKGVKP